MNRSLESSKSLESSIVDPDMFGVMHWNWSPTYSGRASSMNHSIGHYGPTMVGEPDVFGVAHWHWSPVNGSTGGVMNQSLVTAPSPEPALVQDGVAVMGEVSAGSRNSVPYTGSEGREPVAPSPDPTTPSCKRAWRLGCRAGPIGLQPGTVRTVTPGILVSCSGSGENPTHSTQRLLSRFATADVLSSVRTTGRCSLLAGSLWSPGVSGHS